MSKAFTKEDDSGDDAEAELPEEGADQSSMPAGSRNYMTPKGAKAMRDELHYLLHVDRPKVVETVAWAAGNGDRSENADYIYGKRRLREIDRRLRFLQRRMDIMQIVDPALQSSDRVLFGATVGTRDEEETERTYQIVGIDETEAKLGRVSWMSPIGKALLQAKVGDVVTLRTPKGEEEIEIVSIVYRPIE